MSVRLGLELAALRREAGAARSEIAQLIATSPDLGPLVAAGAHLYDLAQASFDDLVAGPATFGPIARALAQLRAHPPVSAAEVAALRVPAAAPSVPAGASRSTEDEPARHRLPARDLAHPTGSRLASLSGDDDRLSATPDPKRVSPVAVAGSRVARLAFQAPAQGRSPMARAGGGRRVAWQPAQPAASSTIARILADGPPEALLVAAAVVPAHGVEPGTPAARSDLAADPLSRSLARLQRRARSAAPAKSVSSTPAPAASDRPQMSPAAAERARGQPRRSALARFAAAGQSLESRFQDTPDPAPTGRLTEPVENAPPSTVERSRPAPPELSAPGDDDELGARLATILRREARRAGIDLTGWP